LLIDISGSLILLQQFNEFDNNIGGNLTLLIINTLLFALKMNGRKHNKRDLIPNLLNIIRLQKPFGLLNDLLINTLLLAFLVHGNVAQGAQ
jgi:hypothetical protein